MTAKKYQMRVLIKVRNKMRNKIRKNKLRKMNKMLKKILPNFLEIHSMNLQLKFKMKKTLFSNKKWNQKKSLVMKKRFKIKNYQVVCSITMENMRKIVSLTMMTLNLNTVRKRGSYERSLTLKRKRNSESNEKYERT